MRLLFAPCGCRRVFLMVLTAAVGLRELGSLQGSSLSGVRPMSRVCSSVGGPVGVAHPFHPSLLLGGVLVYFCGGPCCRSLAMSWACPPPFRIVAPLAPCLRWWYPSFALGRFCSWGISPCVEFRRSPGVLRWLHLYWSVSTVWTYATWGSGRCFLLLPAQLSACIHGDRFISLTTLCMSQPKMSRGVVLFGHMPCWVTGLPSGSLLALPGLCR